MSIQISEGNLIENVVQISDGTLKRKFNKSSGNIGLEQYFLALNNFMKKKLQKYRFKFINFYQITQML